jgi:hypothetical protein
MRSAEAYYHSILGKGDEAILNRPVVIVPSTTHMAPANFDSIPFLVKRTDLQPMVRPSFL